MYFGKEQEKLIETYLQTRCDRFYRKEVHPLLVKVAKGVAGKMRMKPIHLYSSEAVISDCVSLMWEKLVSNFNPAHGRAYSYLTCIAQNYYCSVWRKYHKKERTLSLTGKAIRIWWHKVHNPSSQDQFSFIGSCESFNISRDNRNLRLRCAKVALDNTKTKTPQQEKIKSKIKWLINEAKSDNMAYAILDQTLLHKRQTYEILRHESGLNAKQVTAYLNKIQEAYKKHLNHRYNRGQ